MSSNNALHTAAKAGNLAQVQSLVHNFDINAKGDEDKTALCWAAQERKIGVVKLLLTFHPDVNIPDQNGSTALALAVKEYSNSEVVLALLGAPGIDVNLADNNGDAVLAIAASSFHPKCPEITALLRFADIDVNHANKKNETAIWCAVKAGRIEVVKLLATAGADRSIASNDGKKPVDVAKDEVMKGLLNNNALHTAAKAGNLAQVQSLVHNFDINIKGEEGKTALCWAAREGHTDVVKLLLTFNPDVNIPDGFGQKSVYYAAENGNMAIVSALIATPSIDVNGMSGQKSALSVAAEKGYVDIVYALLGVAGIDVSTYNGNGQTALYYAARYDHTDIVKALVAIPGIDNVNHNDGYGHNALYYAVGNGNMAIVSALIATPGIDINGNGHNALYCAVEKGRIDVVKVLITAPGIDLNAKGPHVGTAMHYAATKSKIDVFIALLNQGANHTIKNEQGKTCFDLVPVKDKLTILSKAHLNIFLLEAYNYALWFVIVQVADTSDVNLFAKIVAMVEAMVSSHPALAAAKDVDGRAAVDVASKPMKLIMQSVLLWHGRYRITEPRPEHISATCFVFKAVDEHIIDKETGQPIKVALKLMRLKDQFQREISTRTKDFDQEHVMALLQTYPEVGSSTFDSLPDEVVDVEADATGQLTKANAEKLFLLVMPLADRNLFVALKQERWAGKNMEEVRHVFVQLVHCVEHMHEKGILHADLKTLNIVRTAGQWKLIDLDAACVIGKEPVGHKSSSAYVPPEAIYVDRKTDSACVRSSVTKGEASYELLTAHPSFDVWSLGCILYQMCTADVKQVLQGGQDDNLVGMRKGVDNLFALAEWSIEMKADKLVDVPDKFARNLLSQMLHKDPLQRPSLARVLAHPFLSGKKVARLIGEKPKYDVFLSYRVASDAQHVEVLYNLLTAQGFKVYWDKLCLLPGVDWEQGFCEGLMSSRAFVPLLSRDSINHPDKAWQNFSKLTADSKIDNVFLEHRLAVELQELGLTEKIFPVFIGDLDSTTSEYSDYFKSGCHPSLSEVTVKSVEEKLRHHMENQALGTPVFPDRTVKSLVDAITACQGAFIVGPADVTFTDAAASIATMLTDVPVTQSPRSGTHVHQALHNTMDNKTLVAEISALNSENGTLKDEVGTLIGRVDRLEVETGALIEEVGTLNDVVGSLEAMKATILATLEGDISQCSSAETLAAHVKALLQG